MLDMFRDGRCLPLRASLYIEDLYNGQYVVDMVLPDEDSKFLLCIRSSALHVRVGTELFLELYYPPTVFIANLDLTKGFHLIT